MNISRDKAVVAAVIQSELLEKRQSIRRITLRGLPGGRILVAISADTEKRAQDIAACAYRVATPLGEREAIVSAAMGGAYIARNDSLPERQPVDEWLRTSDEEAVWTLREYGVSDPNIAPRAVYCLLYSSEPPNFHALKALVAELTWLGAPTPPGNLDTADYEVVVGAGSFHLNRNGIQTLSILQNGAYLFSIGRTSRSHEKVPVHLMTQEIGQHCLEMPIEELAMATNVDNDLIYGCQPNASISIAAYNVVADESGDWDLEEVKRCLRTAAAGSTGLRSELTSSYEGQRRHVLGRLQNRQANASGRHMLRLKSPTQMRLPPQIFQPTNEMETVWIAARLEEAIAAKVWPGFQLIEYTSRDGIDAIARFSLTAGALIKIETVEFEYALHNFFRHAHPIQQVTAIICWTDGGLNDGKYTPAELGGPNLSGITVNVQTKTYVKVLNFGAHIIFALCLKDLATDLGYV